MRSTWRLRRRMAALVLAVLATGVVAGPARAVGDPVLLVHGWRGDPSTWADMASAIQAVDPGRTVATIDLATEDNVKNAAQIRDFITAQGWGRVDIVAQSMGGLSARYFIKTIGTAKVDTYVSLGTPQYGIFAACFLLQSAGGQMCPSSSFLRNLNSGDDTPNGKGGTPVYWTTIYSRTDGVVPTSSSRLDGGACHVETPGPGHNAMDNDPAIIGYVLRAMERDCAGTFK